MTSTSSTSAQNVDLLHLPTPSHTKRKFSFPNTLLVAGVVVGGGGGSASAGGESTGILSARRRLSNVSDVVSRKLSNTIGWKAAPIPAPEIITQGKCLCGQYIRGRLKRAGVYNKKLGLHRMRSFIGTSSIHIVREVYPALNSVSAQQLRKNIIMVHDFFFLLIDGRRAGANASEIV